MSGYVHGDLLTSRARGWGREKEEIVPFFFSRTSRSFSHSMLARCRVVEKKEQKKKNEKKETKTENKRITSVDRLNVPLS